MASEEQLLKLDDCEKLVARSVDKVNLVLPPCAKLYLRNAPVVIVAALS